ncbi:MAG: hypothetical protein N2323_06565 [candidate division WOR-3 bacterium]|nr:hypothetical protein [candidate division WOR-3 bacterium]
MERNIDDITSISNIIKEKKIDSNISALRQFFEGLEFNYVDEESGPELLIKGYSFIQILKILKLANSPDAIHGLKEKNHENLYFLRQYVWDFMYVLPNNIQKELL